MLFKLSNLNLNLALTLGYLNPALNNLAQNKMHLGETDMFLVQIIKRKISVIFTAKPMHLFIQETTV